MFQHLLLDKKVGFLREPIFDFTEKSEPCLESLFRLSIPGECRLASWQSGQLSPSFIIVNVIKHVAQEIRYST